MQSLFFMSDISTRSDAGGFSLIEVLISILILSFGIFGTLKMQVHSIQSSQQSNFYSTATELALDIAEKIRSNRIHIADCVSNQLANAEISEWIKHVGSALPNARAVICRDSAPWDDNTEALTWNCTSTDENASVIIKLGWAEKSSGDDPPPRLAVAVTPYF